MAASGETIEHHLLCCPAPALGCASALGRVPAGTIETGGHVVADVEEDSAPPDAMIRLDGISVRFGGIVALSDVSFGADAGEVLGIIGPNGAGKTTLFDVVSGVRTPNDGRVHLDGADITNRSSSSRATPAFGGRSNGSRPSGGSASKTTSSPPWSGGAEAEASSPTWPRSQPDDAANGFGASVSTR